ncbi:MAG: S9 family peptidase, partial [Dysgonomonas mossii]|nr:S9 family peptidase [Dysgonomonas mossii]
MTRKTYLKCVFLCIAVLSALQGNAQKKVLDHTVYDSWKSISNISITNDGIYTATVVKEQEGDDYLLISNLKTKQELKIPRAYTYSIVPDQKHIIAQIKAPYAVTRQAKIKKTADEKMPKDSLALISLDKLIVSKIPNVKSFKIGKDFSDYIAYTIDDTLKSKDKKESKALTLVLRNLYTSKEDTIKNTTEYIFSRNGKSFATILKPSAKDTVNKPGVLFVDLNNLRKDTVSINKTIYKNLT